MNDINVLVVTTAYEQGVGKGESNQDKFNPYLKDTKGYLAWEMGYEKGMEIRKDKISNIWMLLKSSRDMLETLREYSENETTLNGTRLDDIDDLISMFTEAYNLTGTRDE